MAVGGNRRTLRHFSPFNQKRYLRSPKIASIFRTCAQGAAYCPGARGKAIDCRMPQIPAQRVMRQWLAQGRERGKDFCDGHGAGIRYIGQRARAQVGGTAGSRTIHLRRCLGTRTRHFRRAGEPLARQ